MLLLGSGLHSLIRHMTIKSASKPAYDTDNLDVVTNVKNLLEYGDDSWRSVAKKQALEFGHQ